jgi:predicted kinase
VLVVFTGLPGTGKSAVANAIGAALPAPGFSRDRIEAALWAGGVSADLGSGRAAYDVMTALADEQLAVGQPAVLDSVATTESIRAAWRGVSTRHAAPLRVIQCVCSDARVHRSCLEGRRRDIPGWYELTWSDVEDVRARYEPWRAAVDGEQHLVLAAVSPLAANIAAALAFTRAGAACWRVSSGTSRHTH